VLVSVMLGSFIGMMTSMKGVTVRSMSVMCALFWCARLVVEAFVTTPNFVH
jgi:hypothetical protein